MSTYKVAWKEEDVVIYIDFLDCKYMARGGNLAWRINNPALLSHHCPFAKKNGSIGAWDKFAIFSNPLQGHQALKEWLLSNRFYQSDLYAIGQYYQPRHFESFTHQLAIHSGIPDTSKIKDLSRDQLDKLLLAIEKMCGFVKIGNEAFELLPKIAAKIECPNKEDLYLIGTHTTLTKDEAINRVHSHQLDAVVASYSNGDVYLRSRPRYQMQNLKLTWEQHNELACEVQTLARAIGEKAPRQCIWGFINGIRNTKNEAIESCTLISKKAGQELVLSLPNDMYLLGIKEISAALLLKVGFDTPVVKKAAKFIKYLLALSAEDQVPVILFAHSQGAAITEHALALLTEEERQQVRVFTFGGWSFITPGVTHPDSHNYASIGDIIPRIGSFNLQYLAIRRYEGLREGLNEDEIIHRLAFQDAMHDIDSLDLRILEEYTQQRSEYYKKEFQRIQNVSVLDCESMWEHSFKNVSYQTIVEGIIQRYQNQESLQEALIATQ
jgi:hypothetical protein